MRWSWTLARIAGISVDVHATFLILLVWIALAGYASQHSAAGAIAGIALTLGVFASVVLHEFGHALTAKRFGVMTRSITLLPIGGVAQLERMPEKPSEELTIAIAGPAVTVLIVAVLYLALRIAGAPLVQSSGTSAAGFVAQLMWVNVVLAVFNLLPAFPMDGGRVLRAALAMRMPFAQATEIAARVGKVFALLFVVVGLFFVSNPFLVIIAVFVWLSAAAEASAAQLNATVGDVPVERAMITHVETLEATDLLPTALNAIRAGFQHDFPVVDGNAVVVGVLTREGLLKALSDGDGNRAVADVMERSFASTTPQESLPAALHRLQTCRCRTLPVMRGSKLVGLLTSEKVSEFVMLASAARARHANG